MNLSNNLEYGNYASPRKHRFITYKAILAIASMLGADSFFIIVAFFNLEYTGIENSNSLAIFTIIIDILVLLLFMSGIFDKKIKIYFRDILIFVIPLVGLFFYLQAGFNNGYFTSLITQYFLRFFAWVTPAIFGAFYVARTRLFIKTIKFFEIIMLLITVDIIFTTIIPFIQNQYFSSFGGSSYQRASYLASFAFGLNLYFLFNGDMHERFVIFRSYTYKLICFFTLFIQIISILITASSGAALLALVYLIYISFRYLSKKNMMKMFKWLIFIISFLLLLIFIFSLSVQNPVFNLGIERLTYFLSSRGEIIWENTGRLSIYQNTVDLIKKKPFFGYGFFNIWNIISFYPHNLFLELLLHGGMFFFFFSLIIMFIFFKKLIQLTKLNPKYGFLIILFIYPLVMLMVSGTYLDASLFWFILIYVLSKRLGNTIKNSNQLTRPENLTNRSDS